MKLLLSLQSELDKTKGASIVHFTIIAASLIPIGFFISTYRDEEYINTLSRKPWDLYFSLGWRTVTFTVLPLYLILMSTLLPQIEYRNNTWKQVFMSPQPLRTIFLAKFITLQIYLVLFLISYYILLTFSIVALTWLHPRIHLSGNTLSVSRVIMISCQTYFSFLGISALQFWLGLRFKKFIPPISVGVIFWSVGFLMVIFVKWQHSGLFPFALPFLSLFPGPLSVPHVLFRSIGYCIVLLVLAFIDFSRFKV